MITISYILMALTGILVAAAVVMAFRDRTRAFILMGAALVSGVGASVTISTVLNQTLPANAYDAVRIASGQDSEVDAAAQVALNDNRITPAEFGEIASIYRERTGGDLTELARRSRGKRR